MAILIVASLLPVVLGSKVTTKVLFPPAATLVASGWVVTVKSVVGLIDTIGVPLKLNDALPVFWMVKVLVTPVASMSRDPNSVSFVAEVVVDPLAISFPLPCRLISGAAVAVADTLNV